MTVRNVLLTAGVTMLVMFALNQLAARSAGARQAIKGAVLVAV